MKIVVIDQTYDKPLIEKIRKQYPEHQIFIGLKNHDNTSPQQELMEISEELKSEISQKSMDEVLAFGDKIISHQSITDHLHIQGQSFWHYHKFRIYMDYRNLRYEQEHLKLWSKDFEEIIYFNNTEALKILGVPQNIKLYKSEKKPDISYANMLHYGIFLSLRYIAGLPSIHKAKKAKHWILDRSKRQNCIAKDTLKEVKENYALIYLFDLCDSSFSRVIEEETPKFTKDVKFRFRWESLKKPKGKYSVLFGESILFPTFIKAFFQKKENKTFSSHYLNTVSHIENETDMPFERLFTYYLKKHVKASRFYFLKKKAYARFFEHATTKNICCVDENSPSVRAILDAGQQAQLTRIGIQHGAIHMLHPAYRYTATENKEKILPDMTFTWGEAWSDFLINKANYPKDKVRSCGQIRSDIIPHLQSKSKNKDKTQISLMFASQPQRDPKLRYQAAKDVMTAAAQMPDITLKVKLHPAEYNDKDYYNAIAKEAGCTNYTLIYNKDLYQLINKCDVVITCFSTVGAEAVYFKKPLLIIDPLDLDIQGYIENGVAVKVKNAMDIRNALDDFKKSELNIQEENQEAFIKRYAFSIDGKASERIINYMLQD